MSSNKISIFYLIFSVFFFTTVGFFGCASIQKPTGGPRDTIPPKLLSTTPPDKTKNFNAKQVILQFDEYFKLNNQYQEITISPAMEKSPEYHIKQKSLVIDLKDTLQKNTTYVFNFGKAIGDVNENNILKNFTYVFSTGNEIDSLSISGRVINAETQLPEKEATVFIFNIRQDSALFGKKKPSYYATTDTSGRFKISNLHANTYKIYALKEESPNRIYDNDNELIGILPNNINLKRDTSGILLSVFKQIPQKFRLAERKIEPDGTLLFTFNKSLEKPALTILQPENLNNQKLVQFNNTADTARLYLKNMDFDSIKVAISSAGKPLDTVTLRRSKRDTYKRSLTVTALLNGGGLKPKTNLPLKVNFPIESTNEAQITLNEDSVPKYGFSLEKDTSASQRYTLKYPWKTGKHYDVLLNEGAFIDIYGNKNKVQKISFNVNKEEMYSTLVFDVTVPDTSKAYLFQLMNEDKKVIKTVAFHRNEKITFADYAVGGYRVRIIYDLNRNGKWDTGNVKQRTLPEPIWYLSKLISLRANWELNEPVAVPKPTTQ